MAYDTCFDGIVTSPPHPGLIDYHEQHRHAYELLELDDRPELELGATAAGTSQPALEDYRRGIAADLANASPTPRPDAPFSSSPTGAISTGRSSPAPVSVSKAVSAAT